MSLPEQVLEAAYRRLEKPLYNYLFRWFWDPVECEDLIHDAFERIWKRRTQVDPDRLDALVWTTTLNLARNQWRRGRRWRWLPLPDSLRSGQSPQRAAQLDERDQRLRAALERLPPNEREVILLDVFAGLGSKELASVLGIPKGTLASRKHTATARLTRLLEETDEQ